MWTRSDIARGIAIFADVLRQEMRKRQRGNRRLEERAGGAGMSATVRQFLPQPENACFGCGGANAHGMKLAFEADMRKRAG